MGIAHGTFTDGSLARGGGTEDIAREQVHSEGRVCLINLKTLKSSWHSFLPDPLCPVCSRLPEDSSTAAKISLTTKSEDQTGSYRCRSMDDLNKVLVKDYLDHRTGFLNGKMYDLVPPFADVV